MLSIVARVSTAQAVGAQNSKYHRGHMDWQQTPLNSFTSWKDALNEAVPASQAPPATRVGRCAVVNGAGMSGLMTAVCLRHSFDTVYIFDKDAADLSIGAKLAPSKVGSHMFALNYEGEGLVVMFKSTCMQGQASHLCTTWSFSIINDGIRHELWGTCS